MTSMPDGLDRGVLERKARDELQQIAAAVGAKVGSRAKKADIVDAILTSAGVSAPTQAQSEETQLSSSAASEATAPSVEPVPSPSAPQRAPAADADTSSSSTAPTNSTTGGVTRRRVRTASVDGTGNANTRSAAGSARSAVRREPNKPGATDSESTDSSAQTQNRSDSPKQDDSNRGGSQQTGDQGANVDDADGNKRRRRRRGRDRGQEETLNGEPVAVQGIVDLRSEGYGFLRTSGYIASRDDCYLPTKFVRQHGLRMGDLVAGTSRPATRGDKNPAMLSVETVNGQSLEVSRERPNFDELTPLYPDSKLSLERDTDRHNMTARIIDLVAPIGKGQRGLIVSPPKAGKTTIMKHIAQAIEANNPDVELIVLLIDERPEEVTDMQRSIEGTVIASTFDRPADEHTQVAELTVERAKRLVEDGRDVVIILDGITRLARAYNLSAPPTGRVMSGGIDTGALYPPKKFFGAARNIEEGGSLTILATALVDTGSRMDEVIFEEFKGTGNMELRLDRRLAEHRIFPAIDVDASSTRHEELLFSRQQLQQVWKLRRVLSGLNGGDGAGLELLVDRLKTFKTNDEFLHEIAKAASL
ncbi:MAG: transcription termination factor Rho [Actinobacteria bacterium]|nr:transcription termination factor Rho [Actinomycetota bacterium]